MSYGTMIAKSGFNVTHLFGNYIVLVYSANVDKTIPYDYSMPHIWRLSSIRLIVEKIFDGLN